MMIPLPLYRGVRSYVTKTKLCIWCAYIDVEQFGTVMFKHEPQAYDQQFDPEAPDSLTYCSYGLPDDDNIEAKSHWIIGWDYGHDYEVILGRTPGPSLADIEKDIHHSIDVLLTAYSQNVRQSFNTPFKTYA